MNSAFKMCPQWKITGSEHFFEKVVSEFKNVQSLMLSFLL